VKKLETESESVSEDTNYERTRETAGTSSEFTPTFEVSLHDERARSGH
jgi:hypothetical protein